jgi:hypothetical protein
MSLYNFNETVGDTDKINSGLAYLFTYYIADDVNDECTLQRTFR